MGRPPRITEPGVAYHLLNRRVMRLTKSEKDDRESIAKRHPDTFSKNKEST
jgi:hypothetical protein